MRRKRIIIAILILIPAIFATLYLTLHNGGYLDGRGESFLSFFFGDKKEYLAIVTKTEGAADVLKLNKLRAIPAEVGLEINIGDIIRTKDRSKIEITFSDGSVLGLAANSKINIMDYLVEGDERKKGIIKLFKGKLRAVVTKASKGERPGRFNVITPTAIAGVRGTDFFMFHIKGLTRLAVKEGSVDIYNPTKCKTAIDGNYYREDCGNVIVKAGKSTKVLANYKPEPPKAVTQEEMIIFTEETTIAYVEPPEDPDLKPMTFAEEGETSTIVTASLPKGFPPVHRMAEPLKPLLEINPRDVGRITVADLMKRLGEGKEVLIFDVRDQLAYNESLVKIKGSVRVPVNQLARVAKRLPPGRMIVTYGSRPNEPTSSKAAAILMNNGYPSVFVLEGGLYSWEFYDFPVVFK